MNWQDPHDLLNPVARHRYVVLSLLVGLLILLVMVMLWMGGSIPSLPALSRNPAAASNSVPLSEAHDYFAPGVWSAILPATNLVSPFYTEYFKPPPPPPPKPVEIPKPVEVPKPAPVPVTAPAPAPAPVPAPPTVKKIALLYQGLMDTAAGRQGFVKVGDAQLVVGIGAAVIAEYTVKDLTLQTATLQRSNETKVLNFRVPLEIEVPIK